MNNIYINKSKALSSSLVERVGASTTLNSFVPLKDVAEALALKSTRSLRLELNKNESKYISREVQVNGGISYEILFSSLEPELQDKLRKNEKKSTALIPLNYQPPQFVSDQAKITANFRLNIVLALIKFRKKYSIKKQADSEFLDLYNSGLYLPKAYKFIGSISLGTLHRWLKKYEKHESAEWVLRREGMKAYHDKVEPYIERDISKIEVVDTLFYTMVNENIVIPKFLYYLMSMLNLDNLNEGTTIPSLRTETLNRLEFDIPSLDIQEKILCYLNILDEKISLNSATNNNLSGEYNTEDNTDISEYNEKNKNISINTDKEENLKG